MQASQAKSHKYYPKNLYAITTLEPTKESLISTSRLKKIALSSSYRSKIEEIFCTIREIPRAEYANLQTTKTGARNLNESSRSLLSLYSNTHVPWKGNFMYI